MDQQDQREIKEIKVFLDLLDRPDLKDQLGRLEQELVVATFALMLLLVMSLEFWSSIILEDKLKSSPVLDREET